MYRTHTCGELRASHAGQKVTLCGWVHRRRDHGGVAFFDLRDRRGYPGHDQPGPSERIIGPRCKYPLGMGAANQRDCAKTPGGHGKSKNGNREVEVIAREVKVLNPAKTLPFMVSGDNDLPDENTRLKYRYLDLRRERMTRNMILRHKVIKFMRDYLDKQGFHRDRNTDHVQGHP